MFAILWPASILVLHAPVHPCTHTHAQRTCNSGVTGTGPRPMHESAARAKTPHPHKSPKTVLTYSLSECLFMYQPSSSSTRHKLMTQNDRRSVGPTLHSKRQTRNTMRNANGTRTSQHSVFNVLRYFRTSSTAFIALHVWSHLSVSRNYKNWTMQMSNPSKFIHTNKFLDGAGMLRLLSGCPKSPIDSVSSPSHRPIIDTQINNAQNSTVP